MQNGPSGNGNNPKPEEVIELSGAEKAANIAGGFNLKVADINRAASWNVAQLNGQHSLRAASIGAKAAIEAADIGAKSRHVQAAVTGVSALAVVWSLWDNYKKDREAKKEALKQQTQLEQQKINAEAESKEWVNMRVQLLNKMNQLNELTEKQIMPKEKEIAPLRIRAKDGTLTPEENIKYMKLSDELFGLYAQEAASQRVVMRLGSFVSSVPYPITGSVETQSQKQTEADNGEPKLSQKTGL